jgi:uncharacterized protein YecE (DUF72 family)
MAQDVKKSHVGCAGWSLPHDVQDRFADGASHLHRYATRLRACEINSSFYRPHGRSTYERWAASVPEDFRFSVKLPQAITHDQRLAGCQTLLDEFFEQANGLGGKFGCVLVQLPPSLAFAADSAEAFFEALRARWPGGVAVEPRHSSWFTLRANALLSRHRAARVLADPVRQEAGAMPGGWRGLVYLRLHGSPDMYHSAYDATLIRKLAARIELALQGGAQVWCIFDNTASGAAAGNALALEEALSPAA